MVLRRLTGRRGTVPLKRLLLSPVVLAALVGLLLFVTGLGARLPGVVSAALQGFAALNAPLAMTVLGAYFARVDVRPELRAVNIRPYVEPCYYLVDDPAYPPLSAEEIARLRGIYETISDIN